MASSGMKKKTKGISKRKDSPLKAALMSSGTPKPSSRAKQDKEKQDFSSREQTRTKDSSQSSTHKEKKNIASSQRGQPQGKNAKGTWDDKAWESVGWSEPRRVNKEEHLMLKNALFDSNGKPKIKIIGRPKKPAEEKMNVKTLRLSPIEEKRFLNQAKKEGFPTWQSWIKTLAEERSANP